MTTEQIKKYPCADALIDRLSETQKVILAVEGHTIALREFAKAFKFSENSEYAKYKELLELDEDQLEKIYDLGFIALFASFESFMYEILKELYRKNPEPFIREKQVKYEDLKNLKDIEAWKEYIIDDIAIDKSRDIDKWSEHLNANFGIKAFKDDDQKERIQILNLLRNAILHSGGKTNSKFSTLMGRFLKTSVPIGDNLPKGRRKHFSYLYSNLKEIGERIQLSA